MKKYSEILLRAILAGLMIGLAGTVYLALKNTNAIVGAFLFSFGLLTICALDYKLYTGRVAYIIDNKPDYLIDILLIILGNLMGTVVVALIVKLSGYTSIINTAKHVADVKLDKTYIQMFAQAILCGIMMYLGVEGFKRFKNEFAKVLAVIFAVAIFILAGFEHSVANMYYFAAAGYVSFDVVIALIVMILGNGVGAIIFNFIEKIAHTK
ncbi:formate/nitrite transporter family protein [Acholeplasma hippikon]|uniref:Formate channel 1 n=1 Tax=Acholeplasma hippikon TaxID=264636 RepID=A0A449BIS7_9MOLU|nr:formate/nitrite transporter family protein [Acholeplasma hippikon]VEU82340.1 Formate channel 1 [Acholeplasma hippikon]